MENLCGQDYYLVVFPQQRYKSSFAFEIGETKAYTHRSNIGGGFCFWMVMTIIEAVGSLIFLQFYTGKQHQLSHSNYNLITISSSWTKIQQKSFRVCV